MRSEELVDNSLQDDRFDSGGCREKEQARLVPPPLDHALTDLVDGDGRLDESMRRTTEAAPRERGGVRKGA